MKNINLISATSPEFCCGTTCPRQEVQIRIDRMQRVIDAAHEFMNYGGVPLETVRELKEELAKLSSD